MTFDPGDLRCFHSHRYYCDQSFLRFHSHLSRSLQGAALNSYFLFLSDTLALDFLSAFTWCVSVCVFAGVVSLTVIVCES